MGIVAKPETENCQQQSYPLSFISATGNAESSQEATLNLLHCEQPNPHDSPISTQIMITSHIIHRFLYRFSAFCTSIHHGQMAT